MMRMNNCSELEFKRSYFVNKDEKKTYVYNHILDESQQMEGNHNKEEKIACEKIKLLYKKKINR